MRALLRPARGRLRASWLAAERRRTPPAHPGGAAEHLALRRLPAAERAPRALRAVELPRRAARRLHAADQGRQAGRTARAQGGLGQERRGQPDALVQGPRRLGRRQPRPRAGLRDDRVRLDRQPRQLRRRPRRRARPGLLRLHPVRPRGAEGARDGRLRHPSGRREGQLRRRQPSVHRAVRRARVGVREHQPAPVLRRGLEDARVRDRRAARLGAARPLRRADRLRLAVHENRARLRRVDGRSVCSTASCRR